MRSEICFLCLPLASEQKIASVQLTAGGGPLAADELLTHCMLASHLRPQSRWNGVDLKTLSPAFWLHAKGNGIWYDSHGLIGFIRSHKLEGQEQNFAVSFFEQFPPLLLSIPPAVLNLSFPLYLWPFHFWVPPYQSTLPSCHLHSLSILPHYWPFSFILPPFLYLSSPPGLGCNSACFRAS